MRIVLDTNFYISLLLKSEICALIFERIIEDKSLQVFICKQIISEIFRVASYPRIQKYVELGEVFKLVDFILLTDNIILSKPKPYKKILLQRLQAESPPFSRAGMKAPLPTKSGVAQPRRKKPRPSTGGESSLEDRDDQKVLETTIEAQCDYLITRNLKDFQKAKEIKTLKILTPEKFLQILRIK